MFPKLLYLAVIIVQLNGQTTDNINEFFNPDFNDEDPNTPDPTYGPGPNKLTVDNNYGIPNPAPRQSPYQVKIYLHVMSLEALTLTNSLARTAAYAFRTICAQTTILSM
jgi:hypothetical protein